MNVKASFLAVVACSLLAAGSAQASAVVSGTTPFNQALNYSANPNATGINCPSFCDFVQTLNTTSPLAPATSTYSQNGAWGSVAGFASADLSTGTLRMRASAHATVNGGAFPYMQTNALFGDGFTTTNPNGTPFTWGNQTATFQMNLSGTMTSTDGFANSEGFVMLFLMQKGTLNPNGSLLDPSTSLGYYVWEFGGTQTLYYTDTNGHSTQLTITQNYATLPSTIDATFAPGGDFDWALLFGASGQQGPGSGFDIDLSHTLELGYTGPTGSVTTSTSGIFDTKPAPKDTPEPVTLSLLGAGLAFGRVMRRRRT